MTHKLRKLKRCCGINVYLDKYLCSYLQVRKLPNGCELLDVKDGRLTKCRKKICYGYQAAALSKFGGECRDLDAVKRKDSLVISHLCGTEHCVCEKHLELAPKWLNDERTHCHFTQKAYEANTGGPMPVELKKLCCPHEVHGYCGLW